LPKAYEAQLKFRNEKWKLVEENYEYKDPWWIEDGKRDAEKEILQARGKAPARTDFPPRALVLHLGAKRLSADVPTRNRCSLCTNFGSVQ